eukprot:Phypoly_transcript_03397.p1 GENE.Phypoly_transcript_03397~~Phypoly_transcript_03397.p1  ORF type:complete len:737 (+),score=68.96 Phypoly_transcript_03397:178-2388(+)
MLEPVAHQAVLAKILFEIFGSEKIIVNERKEVKNPQTRNVLEIDIWIPNLQLCFEFQDPYHYVTVWNSQFPHERVKFSDSIKRNAISATGKTLIIVPCWWLGQKETLISEIKFYRPDIPLSPEHSEIPLNPPANFFNTSTAIPGVGELMLASYPTAPNNSNFLISLTNPWWMGEKYDGIRVCWNPLAQQLYTRFSNKVPILPRMLPLFPKRFLDGEMWSGRSNFSEVQSFLKQVSSWCFYRMIAFDEPAFEVPYEERYASILHEINAAHEFLIVAPRILFFSDWQLDQMTQQIISHQGEGTILRKALSFYENGRSLSLFKVKSSRGEGEALVVDLYDKWYLLQLPSGTKFYAHSKNVQLGLTPKPGEIVTFTYEAFVRGEVPANPQIIRIRQDIPWTNLKYLLTDSTKLNKDSQIIAGQLRSSNKPWTEHLQETAQSFFKKVAHSEGFDPLVAENWYSVSTQTVVNYKGAHAIINQFKSLHSALIGVFPNIGLDPTKFDRKPNSYWSNLDNQKRVLDDFAKEKKFDPLNPENWYQHLRTEEVEQFKDGPTVLLKNNNSPAKALMNIYPSIGINPALFQNIPVRNTPSRVFFDNFARNTGFDPLASENWYKTSLSDIIATKNGSAICRKYGSMRKALTHAYPEITFDYSHFRILSQNYWKSRLNRRKVLDEFAQREGFNPLVAENWICVRNKQFTTTKHGRVLMQYYHNKRVSTVAQDLYPEINWDLIVSKKTSSPI